jgi:hypothetical protein
MILFIILYIIGFFVAVWFTSPIDARGEKDIAGQTGSAVLWPILFLYLILVGVVSIVEFINKLKK